MTVMRVDMIYESSFDSRDRWLRDGCSTYNVGGQSFNRLVSLENWDLVGVPEGPAVSKSLFRQGATTHINGQRDAHSNLLLLLPMTTMLH